MYLRTILVATCISVYAAVSFAQNLKADYQFQGNLNSSVAGAPAMTNLGCSGDPNEFRSSTIDGYDRQVLQFEPNCGLAVSTAGVIPNNAYTIVMLFRFDEIDGFRRVVSFDNGVADTGGYILDGRLENESTANVPFAASTYIQVVIVREASGVVRGYRDGGFRVNLNDGGTFQISGANMLRFFQDDPNPPTEAAEGRVARIRLYDAPMTTTQVRALDRVANANGGGDQPILFASARNGFYEIYSSNADGSNHRRLTNNEVAEQGAKWSPDRQKIVYHRVETNPTRWQVWIMNADGTDQTRLTNSATNDANPSWKPDGSKILFSRCDLTTGVCDLVTMNPDGSVQTPIPGLNTADDEDEGTFSPDGSKIAFICSTGGASVTNMNICSANADGTDRQVLSNSTSPARSRTPSYSPDGTKIAYTREPDPNNGFTYEIYIMPSSGGGGSNITNNAFFEYLPIWSPDGEELLIGGQQEGVYAEVYRMDLTGTSFTRLTENSVPEIVSDWYRPPTQVIDRATLFDYDGDEKADFSVFRPADDNWYIRRTTAGFTIMTFGVAGDRMVPADYDGDGKTDVAMFRPSNGTWYIFNSQSQSFSESGWGQDGDLPAPADHDGDGKADLVVFRPSTGMWYVKRANGTISETQFGTAEDKPVIGDFDGDGKFDIGVFRASDNNWYTLRTTEGFWIHTWGQAGDIPAPADYDGDGETDIAIFRPSTGQWYRILSASGFDEKAWGQAGDKPVPADYDGDGKADIGVFRSSNATWYIIGSTSGQIISPFGASGDVPTQSAFIY